MRFLLDTPIGRHTAQFLQQAGHDCVFARERLHPRASDPEIIRCAASEQRTVICFDLDMATLVALSGESLPSVITFRTTRQQATFVNARLEAVLPELEHDLAQGVLATVEDDRVRVRMLPILRR